MSGTAAEPNAVLAVLGRGVVDPRTPIVRADDPGVTRGDGCFEGCRLIAGAEGPARIDNLDAHLARMSRSAAALEIPFDASAWRTLAAEAAHAWTAPGEAAVKFLITRGPAGAEPAGFVWIAPLPADYARQRRDGITVATLDRGLGSDAFASAPWLLGGVKTLSYAVNMAAQREGARRGVDDVVFLATDGQVLEAPTATVVWTVGRELYTPPTGASGILASTVQRVLFERAAAAGWVAEERATTVDDLHAADTVGLVSSTRGPVEIIELDGKSRARRPEVLAEIRRLCGF